MSVELFTPRAGRAEGVIGPIRDFIVQPAVPWFSDVEREYLFRSLKGEIAAESRDRYAIGRINGIPVGAVFSGTAASDPRIGALGYVITEPSHRGKGIARILTEAALADFIAAGGECIHLATGNPAARSVYRACGFTDYNGHVMRYTKQGLDPAVFDETYFTPSTHPAVRPGCWGDLARIGYLYALPHDWLVKDYTEKLCSHPSIVHERFGSVLPSMMVNVVDRKGGLWVLETSEHRIVGAATLAFLDRAARAHAPVADFLTAPAFFSLAGDLVETVCRDAFSRPEVERVTACVASSDTEKLDAFIRNGFRLATVLSDEFRAGNTVVNLNVYRRERSSLL